MNVILLCPTIHSFYGNAPGLRTFIHEQGRYYVMGIPASRRVTPVEQPSMTVAMLTNQLEPGEWIRAGIPGEKGWIWYDWAALRVSVGRDALAIQWLLIRRHPHGAEDLAHIALARVQIEHLFEEAKSELGLADYEVRFWHSWYRHITLVMLAHAWISLIQVTNAKKNPPSPLPSPATVSLTSDDG
jgi:hypothetical protein